MRRGTPRSTRDDPRFPYTTLFRSTPVAAAPLDVPAGAPLAEFFQKYDEAQLSLSPRTKAYRGIRDGDYGKWDDVSDEAEVARHKLQQATDRKSTRLNYSH